VRLNSPVALAVEAGMAEESQDRSRPSEPSAKRPNVDALPASTKESIELLADFEVGEEAQLSRTQALIERISKFFGSPAYFAFALAFIVIWIVVNMWGMAAGWRHVDPPPFAALQGLVSSNALLLTVAVLIRQNRMATIAEHRSHVDLQINLLTEKKAAKILQLLDELQREVSVIRRKPDADLAELTKPADAHALLHAIKEKQGNI
jgi:uncharacterized membrane protein